MGKNNYATSSGTAQTPAGITFKRIVIIVLALIVVIVLLQNARMVTIKFLFWHISMSLALLFPLILLIGLIMGAFIQILLARKK